MLKRLKLFLFLMASFWSLGGHADSVSVTAVLKSQVDVKCQKRVENLIESDYFGKIPTLLPFLKTGSKRAELAKALNQFSSDLLIRFALFFEEEIGSFCGLNQSLENLVAEVKLAYLVKIGMPLATQYTTAEQAVLFRGLILPSSEIPRLTKKLKTLSAKNTPLVLLKQVFSGYVELQGQVVVVSANPDWANKFEEMRLEFCEGKTSCLFWDERFVHRVMIAEVKGVAAFVPSLGVLLLSSEVVSNPNLLNKVVLLHELAHVAERVALQANNVNWRSTFDGFSGWKADPKGIWKPQVHLIHAHWQDELTKLSKDSLFSVFPDEVVVGNTVDGKTFDGMLMEKGYHTAIETNQPSEDLADSIAIFRYLPQRFCWRGKPHAPQKYAWLAAQKFFIHVTKPDCQ